MVCLDLLVLLDARLASMHVVCKQDCQQADNSNWSVSTNCCAICRRQRNRDAALTSYYNRKQRMSSLQAEVNYFALQLIAPAPSLARSHEI